MEPKGDSPLDDSEPTDQRERAGTTIRLHAADGHTLNAYRVHPREPARGALVVLHEIFGVTAHIRNVCDRFAADGFSVVAPALFDRVRPSVELGYDADGIAAGRVLRDAIGWDASLRDVQAAIDAAAADGPVAVLGYCLGGTLAFLAAARLTGLYGAVGYYGGQIAQFIDETPRVPLLLHFGDFDPRVGAEDRERIRRRHPEVEIHSHPADHGFNCDHRKEWHAPSAAKALGITLDFLERHRPPA